MKLLIQRVLNANVVVGGQEIARIDQGLLVLVGFGHDDTADKLPKAIDKLVNLRVFADQKGRFQYSCVDQDKGVLLVPQFTLYGSTNSGRRPDFINAMAPKLAEQLFDQLYKLLQAQKLSQTGSGEFGADMQISLVNDGPVTLMIEL